jgi:Flp pilus assembly protein TadG
MIFRLPRQFRRDHRGNVAMMYALALPILMFGTGLAIDFTHAAQVRTELNAAADAAVLAALTPSMMQQSNATAQTAAQNMFDGEIANLTSLAATDTNVTITITNPNNNPLVRTVTVSYTAQNTNIFAGVLGAPTMALAGTSTASASVAANIDFYLLLDNSPSMGLPSSTAGINSMVTLTSQQGGCALACHMASTNNSETEGNPCALTVNSTTTYTTPTLNSGMNGSGNSYCNVSTQGAQVDNETLAHLNGIQLRIDALNSGIGDLMTDASTAAESATTVPAPAYRFAAYAMDSPWQIGMTSGDNYNQLMALTPSYVSGWSAASGNFGLMEYFANSEECSNSACSANGGGDDIATNYDNALSTMNTIMPNPGNGTNIAGDTPQEVLFFVTDGVEDEDNPGRLIQVINGAGTSTNYCSEIKNRGIRIAILYTYYYPVTSNSFYNSNVAPFQTNIGPALEACASPGLFYEAGVDDNLASDLQTLFNTVTQTAHLTN